MGVGLVLLAAELGVGRVKGGHVFQHLLARLVLRVQIPLGTARVAPCHEVLLLDFVGAFGILALVTQYKPNNKSKHS